MDTRHQRDWILRFRSFFVAWAVFGVARVLVNIATGNVYLSVEASGITILGVPFVQVLLSLVSASVMSLVESLQIEKPPADRRSDTRSLYQGVICGVLWSVGLWLGKFI